MNNLKQCWKHALRAAVFAGLFMITTVNAGTDSGPALSASESLRVLYRSALERMGLVVLLFALGLGVLELEPLALLTGFIAGQTGLVLTGLRRKN